MKLFILTLLASFQVFAVDYVKIDHLYLETTKNFGTSRVLELSNGEEKKGELNLSLKTLHLSDYVYNKIDINSFYTDRQFRNVELNEEVGFQYKALVLFVNHRSSHCLDCGFYQKYPNENQIGIRFYLIKGK